MSTSNGPLLEVDTGSELSQALLADITIKEARRACKHPHQDEVSRNYPPRSQVNKSWIGNRSSLGTRLSYERRGAAGHGNSSPDPYQRPLGHVRDRAGLLT